MKFDFIDYCSNMVDMISRTIEKSKAKQLFSKSRFELTEDFYNNNYEIIKELCLSFENPDHYDATHPLSHINLEEEINGVILPREQRIAQAKLKMTSEGREFLEQQEREPILPPHEVQKFVLAKVAQFAEAHQLPKLAA